MQWTPEDCLGHKLTFKKREDAKVLKETLLAYVKRLRALGWHLLHEKDGWVALQSQPPNRSTHSPVAKIAAPEASLAQQKGYHVRFSTAGDVSGCTSSQSSGFPGCRDLVKLDGGLQARG